MLTQGGSPGRSGVEEETSNWLKGDLTNPSGLAAPPLRPPPGRLSAPSLWARLCPASVSAKHSTAARGPTGSCPLPPRINSEPACTVSPSAINAFFTRAKIQGETLLACLLCWSGGYDSWFPSRLPTFNSGQGVKIWLHHWSRHPRLNQADKPKLNLPRAQAGPSVPEPVTLLGPRVPPSTQDPQGPLQGPLGYGAHQASTALPGL